MSDTYKTVTEELIAVLEVAIARGEQLGYADEDYKERLMQLNEWVEDA